LGNPGDRSARAFTKHLSGIISFGRALPPKPWRREILICGTFSEPEMPYSAPNTTSAFKTFITEEKSMIKKIVTTEENEKKAQALVKWFKSQNEKWETFIPPEEYKKKLKHIEQMLTKVIKECKTFQ